MPTIAIGYQLINIAILILFIAILVLGIISTIFVSLNKKNMAFVISILAISVVIIPLTVTNILASLLALGLTQAFLPSNIGNFVINYVLDGFVILGTLILIVMAPIALKKRIKYS